ncbi:MAG: hypothetical protein KatS3mg011_1003 [Acidimicrobiia bacterium]|nr:MAG: hypothetical protein KatS3mg011_1003 [Acidimicrobiia bacterium]
MNDTVAVVELRGITKRFPGVVANDDVNLVVEPSTIHAVVGENGAGKSTLMKILYGMLTPTRATSSSTVRRSGSVRLGTPSNTE